MKSVLSSLLCLVYVSQHVSSTPLALPRPLHEVHVDLIDSIIQIPIQTLNGVANLLKNVHNKKRNFISVNVHMGRPEDRPYAKPETKPDSYPKPDRFPRPESSPFPDYQPSYTPTLSASTVRPVVSTGITGISFPQETKPDAPSNEVNEPWTTQEGSPPSTYPHVTTQSQPASSDKPTIATEQPLRPLELTAAPYQPTERPFVPSQQTSSFKPSERPVSGYKPPKKTTPLQKPKPTTAKSTYRPTSRPTPTYERVPAAPAVQPLSLETGELGGLNFDKPSNREKNFKEYVQRKLAEKNLQDNRISNTF